MRIKFVEGKFLRFEASSLLHDSQLDRGRVSVAVFRATLCQSNVLVDLYALY